VRVADTRAAPPYLAELNRRAASADSCIEFAPASSPPQLLGGVDLLVVAGPAGQSAGGGRGAAPGIAVAGEIELFAWALRDLDVASRPRVMAITGTNGKTTTTALTGHLLAAPASVSASPATSRPPR
jgi:UDP-N-acetylmuramoylalanine--D-glutamate ligase